MSKLVIIVALETKHRFKHVEQRHLGIGVMSADHQHHAVQQDPCVQHWRQRKTAARVGQYREPDHRGRNLERPGRIIVRVDAGPDQHDRENGNPRDIHLFTIAQPTLRCSDRVAI